MANEDRLSNRLLYMMIAGIVVGALLGGLWPAGGRAVNFLGDLFIRALLALAVPLVMTSVIVGMARLGNIGALKGLGAKTLLYFVGTTGIAVVIGLLLVVTIRPGGADTAEERVALRGGVVRAEAPYRVDGIDGRTVTVPEAFVRSYDDRFAVTLMDQGLRAEVVRSEGSTLYVGEWRNAEGQLVTPRTEGTGISVDLAVAAKVKGKARSIGTILRDMVTGLVPKNLFASMANNEVLPLIVFALVFGIALTMLGEKGRPVHAFIDGLNEVIMQIVHLLMMVAPFGIAALIAGRLGEAGGFAGFWPELQRVGAYALTVILALGFHGLVVLPLLLKFVGRQPVAQYTRNVAPALTTAFSTASSNATLPLSIETSVEHNHLRERVVGFVIPLGATVNMNGTALYEAIAAVFIAQMYGVELGPVQLVLVFLTATLAAIGAAGIPEAGLVTMVVVLQAVDLPVEGISLLLIIDWFLDRCRTVVNVWGDIVGAGIISRLHREP